MKLKLIRHAQSYANVHNDLYSQVPDHNIDITPTGVEQANALCIDYDLKSDDKILVITSPYLRTIKTRDIILGNHYLPNVTNRIEPLIHERRLARNWDELPNVGKFYFREKSFGHWWYSDGGLESYNDVYIRAHQFRLQLEHIKATQKYDCVIIISHCVFLNMLRCIIEEQTDIEFMTKIPHFNNSCSIFDCEI